MLATAKGGNMKKGYAALVAEAEALIETVSPSEAQALQAQEGVVLVDLREKGELRRDGRVPGAVHVPRGMLEFWIDPTAPISSPNWPGRRALCSFAPPAGARPWRREPPWKWGSAASATSRVDLPAGRRRVARSTWGIRVLRWENAGKERFCAAKRAELRKIVHAIGYICTFAPLQPCDIFLKRPAASCPESSPARRR